MLNNHVHRYGLFLSKAALILWVIGALFLALKW